IIFLFYIIFVALFNLFVSVFSYKKVETFTIPQNFEVQPLSSDKMFQQSNNKIITDNNEEEKNLVGQEIFSEKNQEVIFPQDEAAHARMLREWWYLSANVVDVKNQEKKFNLVLLLYKNGTSLFKISNLENGKNYFAQLPLLTDVNFSDKKLNIDFFSGNLAEIKNNEYRLYFNNKEISIDLSLVSLKKPFTLINNENFLYYQQTRVETFGNISFDGQKYEVKGLSWIDHQGFSSSEPTIHNWRWLAIQLDNNIELVWLYFLSEDAKVEDFFNKIIIYSDGKSRVLDYPDFSWHDSKYLESQKYGEKYPVTTDLFLPSLATNLKIDIFPPNQGVELMGGLYEGGGNVSGHFNGKKVTGIVQQEITSSK
ncbi:MAG: lipocalin family protein, partial [bacterium]